MDGLLVVGIAISVALALGLAAFFLAVKAERRRRNQGQAVTVAELLEDAKQHGEPLRLNWSRDELDAYGRVRPEAHDDLPTGVFPAVRDSNNRYRNKQ